MQLKVNGINLFFDVEGIGFIPDQNKLTERPSLILLHGGPGNDHSSFRPAMSVLADTAQVIYLDLRGHGRSDRSDSSRWNIDQWTEDLSAFTDALGLNKPVVFGQSFGGFIAQSVALKYPEKIGKIILSSSMGACRFDRIIDAFNRHGNEEISKAAREFWNDPTNEEVRKTYRRLCGPLYNTTAHGRTYAIAGIRNEDVLLHFYGPSGEGRRVNFLKDLKDIRVPTLVLSGDKDHISTPEDARDLVNALPKGLTRSFNFKNSGHGPYRDEPEAVFPVIRHFLSNGL